VVRRWSESAMERGTQSRDTAWAIGSTYLVN
jgi:hypothetical protein